MYFLVHRGKQGVRRSLQKPQPASFQIDSLFKSFSLRTLTVFSSSTSWEARSSSLASHASFALCFAGFRLPAENVLQQIAPIGLGLLFGNDGFLDE